MPLNPQLYDTLEHKFGRVRIINSGQDRCVRRVPDPDRPGQFRTEVVQRGEQYAINCPFCADQRGRLFISFAYGLRDPQTGHRNFRLFYCQNELCHQAELNVSLLRSWTTVPIGRAARYERPQATTVVAEPPPPETVQFPESTIAINALSRTHPAVSYVLSRGFDPHYLANTWGICYCDAAFNTRPIPTGRLLIPVWQPNETPAAPGSLSWKLTGWQARVVPGIEPLACPDAKYVSAAGMPKSKLLYGLGYAPAAVDAIVVMEGVSDVWRFGPGAVALFGKTASSQQLDLLTRWYAGKPVVVVLDRDAAREAQQLANQLRRRRQGCGDRAQVVVAQLPPGRADPGECTREELLQAVAAAMATSTISGTVGAAR